MSSRPLDCETGTPNPTPSLASPHLQFSVPADHPGKPCRPPPPRPNNPSHTHTPHPHLQFSVPGIAVVIPLLPAGLISAAGCRHEQVVARPGGRGWRVIRGSTAEAGVVESVNEVGWRAELGGGSYRSNTTTRPPSSPTPPPPARAPLTTPRPRTPNHTTPPPQQAPPPPPHTHKRTPSKETHTTTHMRSKGSPPAASSSLSQATSSTSCTDLGRLASSRRCASAKSGRSTAANA